MSGPASRCRPSCPMYAPQADPLDLPKTMLRRGVERYGWGVGVVATLGGRIG